MIGRFHLEIGPRLHNGYRRTGAPYRRCLGKYATAEAFSVPAEIIPAGAASVFVNPGPHPPRLWPEDVDTALELWLDLSAEFGAKVHHRNVVGLVLRRMKQDLYADERPEILSPVKPDLSQRV